MIGFGLILILGGLIALYFAIRLRSTIQVMEDTPTTPVKGIKSSGYYEVKGTIRCDHPLGAPRTGAPCVYYHHVITEQYEESYRDSEGDYKTRTKSRTILNETRSCPFGIQDSTGTIQVQPDGATFEATVSESGRSGSRDSSWKAEMGAAIGMRTREHQGQREVITVIPVASRIYAIGAVEHHPAGLTMQADKSQNRAFRISMKSEEEQLETLGFQFKLAAAGVLGGFGGGIFLLLKGFAER